MRMLLVAYDNIAEKVTERSVEKPTDGPLGTLQKFFNVPSRLSFS
jgi:hypothetical protein